MSIRATTAADDRVLRLEGVTRDYANGRDVVRALRGVSLTVHTGEMVALIGPSGSGKSTLMMLAGGLLRPTGGSVFVDGIDLGALDSRELAIVRRRQVGLVFQDYNLVPSLTAGENVSLPLELDGLAPRAVASQAQQALATVGLDGLERRFPDELSGGQRQRVAIARALVGSRRLVLADEPTGALDSDTGAEVLSELRARASAGASVVVVTHDRDVAVFADRVVALRDGLVESEWANQSPARGGSVTGMR